MLATILAVLAALSKFFPWAEKVGDVMYEQWKRAQLVEAQRVRDKYLADVDARSAADAAKVDRFMADAEAAKAKSERADAPPPPSTP